MEYFVIAEHPTARGQWAAVTEPLSLDDAEKVAASPNHPGSQTISVRSFLSKRAVPGAGQAWRFV